MRVLKNLIIFLILIHSPFLHADTLNNARTLFDFGEANYPSFFSPIAPPIQEAQGYYFRYYSNTGVYLGVKGDGVYALGGDFGSDVRTVGKISDFVTIPDVDITNRLLTNRRTTCSYYAEHLVSNVTDIQRSSAFSGTLKISVEDDQCVFISNSIPNHDFNDETARFATPVSAINAEYRVPISPRFAASSTPISLATNNVIFLNGVKLDLVAAGCFGVGSGRIGCNDMNQSWRYDPMSPTSRFGTDRHNAHTQADGAYHYHGNPNALFDQNPTAESPVIGFAADGFPVFGSFINDNSQIRAVTSSYQLRNGRRPTGEGNPGGRYDGTFIDDYEYVAGSGDLDECNGMTRNGAYGYYVVDQYPWVLACYKGTPDPSFNKRNNTRAGFR